jgi:hypothetical protein
MPIVKNPEDLDYDYLEKLYESKVFEDYSPKEIKFRKYEEIKASKDKLTFKLIDKTQRDLVSLIHGEINIYHDIEYFEIVWAYSKFHKRGYLTYLFELLIYEFDYKVLSDKWQTSPGSKEFWQSHINKNKFGIYRLNLDSNYKRNAKKFREDEIWDIPNNNTEELIQEIYNAEDFSNEISDENTDLIYQNELIESIEREIKNYNFANTEIEVMNTKKETKEKIRLVAQNNIG